MCKANLSTWTVRKWRSYYRLLSHTPLTICLLTPCLTAWTLHRARLPRLRLRDPELASEPESGHMSPPPGTPETAVIGREWSRDTGADCDWSRPGAISRWLAARRDGPLRVTGRSRHLHAKPTRSAGKGETITGHGVWWPGERSHATIRGNQLWKIFQARFWRNLRTKHYFYWNKNWTK